jgi:hypothetical protein
MPTFTPMQAVTLVRNFGSFDTVRSFAELVAAEERGEYDISIDRPITMTDDLTITSAMRILEGGVIDTNSYTLTINGAFSAGAYQVFDTAAGDVVLGPSATQYVLFEWFGAVGVGPIDDTAAIEMAMIAAVSSGRAPVMPLSNKNYGVTTVNVPARTTMLSDMGRTSGATFTGLDATPMFQLPLAYSENQITFRGGMNIYGDNIASACINTGFASGLVLDGVNFTYADTLIDHTGGGIINYITRCRFTGNYETAIKIGGISNAVHIRECLFAGTGAHAIETDSTWTGDNLHVTGCTVDTATLLSSIKIARLDNATATLHFVIDGCRFDASPSVSHIDIGQYCYGNIEGNGFSGTTPTVMKIGGDEVYVANNYITNNHGTPVGITFTADSRYCIAGPQKWGGFSPHYVNSGTQNWIDPFDQGVRRIGTTVQRPTLFSSGMTGFCYLDTTLAAAGKPIFWNDSAWVDATGAVV